MREAVKEYAMALFSLATEEGTLEETDREMKEVLGVFLDHPEYVEMLGSPTLTREEKNRSLDEVFASVSQRSRSTVKLLCEHGHIREFEDFFHAFDSMVQFSMKRLDATVRSVVPLSDEEKETLLRRLEKKTGKAIDPHYILDPSLIGGIRVEMDGYVYDGSLRRSLDQMKEVLNK